MNGDEYDENYEEAKRKILAESEPQIQQQEEQTSLETEVKPKSVLEMKRVKEGQVIGFGRVVAVGEQYQAVSQISAICDGMVPCGCDASDDEHERRCGYKVHIDFTIKDSRPPTPIILSLFDAGNGKPQICPRCKQATIQVKIDFRRAKLIQLQDIDNRIDNARQDVILYDDMVDNLSYNEIVQVEGNMFVERRPGASKNTVMDNRLHATSIAYLKPKDVAITEQDIKIFHRWKEICVRAHAKEIKAVERFKQQSLEYNCIACQQLARKIIPISLVDRQAAAIASNVIGNLPARAGMLRTLVGATNRGPGRLKGKINTLFIGDKGTAKSSIGDEGLRIHPNSGKVTATHATGKAVTGIVDKDAKMLVLGILPASDFVLLDEVDKLPREEQSRLLGILEENHFSKDAYALHYEVDTNVAIVATANPTNTDWIDEQRVNTDEIGLIPTLKDRFTQIFTFRDDLKDKQKRMAFAKAFAAIRKKDPPNYSFFTKLWIHESGLKPEITPDADKILYEFWASQDQGAVALMDTRFLNHIYKIAEAQAKLNLSEQVTEQIADQTQQAVLIMLVQYGENIKTIPRPSEILFYKCLEILENTKAGIVIEELSNMAKKEDTQIAEYLGTKSKMEETSKIRKLVTRLLQHPKIKCIQENPKVLKWVEPVAPVAPVDGFGANAAIESQEIPTSSTSITQNTVTDATDATDRNPQNCNKCGHPLDLDPFYAKIHLERCDGTIV